jgi:site-specific recombinase XerD
MFEYVINNPRVCREIEAAGFKPSLEALATKLHSEGYAEATVSFYDQAAVHFAYWVARRHVDPSQIDETHLANFLARHLPTCRCPFGGVRQDKTVRAGLHHFDAVLSSAGDRVSNQEKKPDPLSLEIQRFDDYLRTASGLQEATRIYRRRYVREFLHQFFRDGAVAMSRLTPKDVIAYVSKRAARLKAGSAKVLASSLRSYFRFLRLHGECEEALDLAVPAPATHRLASLPRVLTDGEMRRLFAVFDRRTVAGRRDYAITRCFTNLGLRAEEVARLRLDDIDWRHGIVRIVGTKSRRDDQLPLTNLIGEAIAAYILRGRPQTPTRQVFLRVYPPIGKGATPRTVRGVILRAAARAGLKSIVTGNRILRHTAATHMLRHGASLKEVADVLRHRSLDTTTIYTKVDLPRLAAVAVPWPEEVTR